MELNKRSLPKPTIIKCYLHTKKLKLLSTILENF
jgi:hypothetical protein